MFNKLRNNLLLFNMLITSIVIITAFVVIYGIVASNTNQSNLERIKRMPLTSLGGFSDFDGYKKHDNYNGYTNSFNLILHEDGTIDQISSTLDYEDNVYEEIVEEIFDHSVKTSEINVEEITWLYDVTVLNNKMFSSDDEILYRIAFLDITDSINTLNYLLFTFIGIGFITLIVVYFISKYFADKSIKPVEIMWQKQKDFVANATHELKTPLTIIGANADVLLLDEKLTIKKQAKWINGIKNETKGMNKLINDLLESAKVSEEVYELGKANISDTLLDSIISFETLIYEKDISLVRNIEDNINCVVDKDKFVQVIRILLDNALKYTPSGEEIKINLYKKQRSIYLEIINTGNRISEDDIPFIFDRFYKVDKARTNINNSYGLGLYIAKNIVTNLNGSIVCISNDRETVFKIKL